MVNYREQLIETTRLAKKRFVRQPLRVWYCMIGEDAWRAFVFNVRSKVMLCEGPLCPTPEDALDSLKLKIESRTVGKTVGDMEKELLEAAVKGRPSV